MKKLMLGNEAVARGAYEAGASVVSSYPGTPSTEITENIVKYDNIYVEWAPNEKVACEVAVGASIAGARSMTCMKHVGLNVMADPVFTVSYTGVNGGMVICVADDQGMHSSQNEQDSPNRRKIQTKIQMKSLTHYIQEKLIIKKKSNNYNYFPQTKEELRDIILQRIKDEGNEVDLNDIDVSNITDMHSLFSRTNFNGDISKWDVSNVTDMSYMFYLCRTFNQDISKWDVSNVTDMSYMFYNCNNFDKDISNWDVSNVTDMYCMFYGAKIFNQDISTWNVSNVEEMSQMFCGADKLNQDISKWNVSNVTGNSDIFERCPIEEKYKPNF